MLTVFGSTALDTIRTPKKTLKNVLGGAATFAAISASNFVDTGLIAVVGKDFPKQHHKILSKYLLPTTFSSTPWLVINILFIV